MVRLAVLSFHHAALVLPFLVTGCIHNHSEPRPRPVELGRPPPAVASERCAVSAEAIAPPGKTPLPTTEGELRLVDVRGDDRVAFHGSALFTWSREGDKLVSASRDGVMLWDAATGALERTIDLPARLESPRQIVMSPDDQWIALAAHVPRDDLSSPAEAPALFLMRASGEGGVQRFEHTGGAIFFSSDSRRLVAPTQVWDLVNGTHRAVPPPTLGPETTLLPGHERGVSFVRQGEWPKERVTPELRDLVTGGVLHRFPPLGSSTGASLSGDGKRLALLHEGKMTVYSTETFERVAFIPDVGKAQMVHLSHDGHRAVTEVLMCAVQLSSKTQDMSWCPKPELIVWDLGRNEKLIQTPNGSGSGWVFTPDGEYLTGPETRLVDYIVRIRDGQELRFGSRIRTISPGNQRVLFDGALGFELAALDGKSPVPSFAHAPRVLARSADGKWQVNAGSDGRLRLESATTCLKLPMTATASREPRSTLDHFSDGGSLSFSTDGLSLYTLTAPTSMNTRFRAYDTQTGAERWSIQTDVRNVGHATILPLADQVVFQGYNHPDLRRFHAVTGAELTKGGMPRVGYVVSARGEARDVRSVDGDRAESLHAPISDHTGTRLAMSTTLANKCTLSIWDIRDPRSVDDRYPGCLSAFKALSPDEKWIAAGTERKGALLVAWDGDEARRIEGMHEGRTTAIVYSPSGDRLAVADDQGNIALADPREAKVKGRARLPLDHATHLWISPDSRMIVADTARGMRVRLQIEAQPRP